MTTPSSTSSPQGKASRLDTWVIYLVIVFPFFLALVGYYLSSLFLLSIAAGAIGGIIHDLVQNKGLLLVPKPTAEGYYMGIGLGAILGAVAGFFAFAALTAPFTMDAKTLAAPLTGGIGLKGLSEAAANKSIGSISAAP